MSRIIKILFALFLLSTGLLLLARANPQRRVIDIFIDVRETNLDKASTVANNTLLERLKGAGFKVTSVRREAELIIDGTFVARLSSVTEEVKKEGGINAEATGSVRLLAGNEVIATSVERSDTGDWGVVTERIGEDRLIEVAGRVADDLFSSGFVREILEGGAKSSSVDEGKTRPVNYRTAKQARNPGTGKNGVSFLELTSLVQNYAPEERILAALRKYGIKFKPLNGAITQLRSMGASQPVIDAVISSTY